MPLIIFSLTLQAQQIFRNLTAEEVKIDSVLPRVNYSFPLSDNHSDSVYTLRLLYPEFLEMSASEVEAYKKICGDVLPGEMPEVGQYVSFARKRPVLTMSFCPVVFRDGRYQYLVSFLPEMKAEGAEGGAEDESSGTVAAKAKGTVAASGTVAAERYAEHSLLAKGKWAKIRVSETGIHELTAEVVSKAGFSNIDKVKVYGYGGNLVPEVLTDSYLRENDDVSEVATCKVGGRRLFYAKGPVSWSSSITTQRTRNPYSNYGYYFITESDEAPKTCTEEELVAVAQKANDNYHYLYEKDEYAWFSGGRNLYESTIIAAGSKSTYKLMPHETDGGTIAVAFASNVRGTKVNVYLNDVLKETRTISMSDYDKANSSSCNFPLIPGTENVVTIENQGGGPVRLDYISMTTKSPAPLPDIKTANLPKAEYVKNISNQDLHADSNIDMVIIIPASQNTIAQAERLKAFHETHDSLKVRIVPADELYNEFSSGTPDASAYRRYMKMLYDRAKTAEEAPRYLLLFGDCSFDNRMLTQEFRNTSPDNYLLCFESEDSFNEISCYVSDDFFALLDDNESISSGSSFRGIPDVGVGRFTCSNSEEAKVFVDKTINYATTSPSGSWQNTLMFLGDDGNNNIHMRDVNEVAEAMMKEHPGYYVRKVMWDAYNRESSSTGHRYPQVTSIIKQQQAEGALLIDYAGHGSEMSISHEAVLVLKDFEEFRGSNLPLWITASCDIMPFDGSGETIGEAAVLNPNGGAMAFYGTTRTVLSSYNKLINKEFVKNILSFDASGKPLTLGEANRLTKENLVTSGQDESVNKLQYSLIGDPALALALPTIEVKLDSINGKALDKGSADIRAGEVVRMSGHVERGGKKIDSFRGLVSAIVRDTKETIVCKLNNTTSDGAEDPFVYTDRTNILFQGADSVKNGKFSFLFAVPKDIHYDEGTGLVNLYAVNNEHTFSGHGASESFRIAGGDVVENDSIGPSIYCYLNSPDFTYGGTVNSTPFFVAEINDKDGINASGSGIGHDMQLTIDGDITKTYNLNDNFQFDFGSYTSGRTYFILPKLEEGEHTLRFRAWDILNNSSTSTLTFNVRKGLQPNIASVSLARNPVKDVAQFIITHDRMGSDISLEIDVMDTSGRLLWRHAESGTSTGNVMNVTWNLTAEGGATLNTGVYLYRVKLSCEGSSWASAAKKMIVVR